MERTKLTTFLPQRRGWFRTFDYLPKGVTKDCPHSLMRRFMLRCRALLSNETSSDVYSNIPHGKVNVPSFTESVVTLTAQDDVNMCDVIGKKCDAAAAQ